MKRVFEDTPRSAKIPRTASKEKKLSTSKDPVSVYCRLKPLEKETRLTSIKLLSSTTLSVSSESKNLGKTTNYTFKNIFTSDSTQQQVFESVGLPLLNNLLLKSQNGLLFTYGVTGSGKTFTLTGETNNPGIIPCCIHTLFNSIQTNQHTTKYVIKPDRLNGFEILSESEALEERFKATKNKPALSSMKRSSVYINNGTRICNVPESALYTIFISYIEIYNNSVYDLLDETNGKTLQNKILREDSYRGMYVNAVVEVEVKSAEEALDVFSLGQLRKRMGNTVLNAESSRSHSIFIIRVVQLEGDKMKTSQLSLVDLAGSERSKRTHTTGARLKEASSINNSLMTLRACLEILRENQLSGTSRLVPYRDSRLTLLFKSYFEGLGQVRMIVCVSPSFEDYEENIQVLKFAETSQDIKISQTQSRHITYLPSTTPKFTKSLKTIQSATKLKAKKPLRNKCNLPRIVLSLENPDANIAALDSLILTLKKKQECKAALIRESKDKENEFRNRLVNVLHTSKSSKHKMKDVKSMIDKENQTTVKLEKKIVGLERQNNDLTIKNQQLESQIQSLQIAIEQKNVKMNSQYINCERDKRKLALETEMACKNLNKKLKQQYEQLESNMKFKTAKIQKVKDLLNDETPIVWQPSTNDDNHEYNPQQTPPTCRRNLTKTLYKQRRSRSAGDVYLEHNVVTPVPLGTVFQPLMNKSKSVSKLEKMKDIISAKQNRYCLIAQEANTVGEIETKMYKGDIVPTCGGGAQVIFDDVERLKQESPTKY